MTTSAAETTAGRVADKEKVEKRRALGRGLESLLPGPRVVGGTAARPVVPPVRGTRARGQERLRHTVPLLRILLFIILLFIILLFMILLQRRRSEFLLTEPFVLSWRKQWRPSPPSCARADSRGRLSPHWNLHWIPRGRSGSTRPSRFMRRRSRGCRRIWWSNLTIADIDKNPFQTRYVDDDDALEELADSIKANGVVQPIMVRPSEEEGRYILILG